jgi:HSP20 family protein
MVMRFSDPFEAFLAFQKQLDARLASDWLGNSTANMGAYPPINIFQQQDDFVAVVELPGVNKTDLTIEAKEGTLRVSGKKTLDYQENASIHRRERLAGSFDRTITLPIRIDPNRIRAECRDGILAIFIPRAETDKPRTIEIK